MRNGLQTTVFGFIESSINMTRLSDRSIPDALAMPRLAEINAISLRVGEAIDSLARIFLDTVEKSISSKGWTNSYIFTALCIAWLLVYYFSFHRYFSLLSDKMWLTQGMVGMLPFQTVIHNQVLYKEIARWRNI